MEVKVEIIKVIKVTMMEKINNSTVWVCLLENQWRRVENTVKILEVENIQKTVKVAKMVARVENTVEIKAKNIITGRKRVFMVMNLPVKVRV